MILKYSMLGIAIGIASGIVTSVLFVKCMNIPNLRKWCARIESEQIDTEIRVGLLEYNHLHEDDNLQAFSRR